MSFEFKWPHFSSSFYDHAKRLLFNALNKGEKPPIIADRIEVENLDMGSIPPELEILEIGDLGSDRFRGIFRMTYVGDASICLRTKVQANPLRQKSSTTTPDIITTPAILFATTPLIVPMTLKLSALRLRAIVVLVVSRLEGVTLVFKNDPLESVQVSSTFDSVSAIQAFLQAEIERQLRELFRNELPGIIHQLSRRWLKPSSGSVNQTIQPSSSPSSSALHQSNLVHPLASSSPNPTGSADPLLDDGVPEQVESYDPTYGLRPSHPPLTGCFSRYRSLLEKKTRTLGLGVILASSDDEEVEGEGAGDVPAEDSNPETPNQPLITNEDRKTSQASSSSSSSRRDRTVTQSPEKRMAKPRIFHSHSAGLVSSQSSSSAVSSLLGQDDCPSIRRESSPRGRLPLDAIREVEDEKKRVEHQEGELLRNRRMERFSMHEKAQSTSSLPTLLRSQNSGLSSSGVCNTPLSSPRPTSYHAYNPSLSILPSTTAQRSSLPSPLNPQHLEKLQRTTSLSSTIETQQGSSSPIFLASRSSSSSEAHRSEFNLEEEITESFGEGGPQCALLASLVRGNWTLSPFSQSISHYASRSTPLSPERKSKRSNNLKRQQQLRSYHEFMNPKSSSNRSSPNLNQDFPKMTTTTRTTKALMDNDEGLNLIKGGEGDSYFEGDPGGTGGEFWGNYENLEGFRQKRVTRIGKLI